MAQVETEISKAVSVVDEEEIKNRSATQLADIVRYTPGFKCEMAAESDSSQPFGFAGCVRMRRAYLNHERILHVTPMSIRIRI